MGFFNLGKKDDYGKQSRIEHRGKHLRASRTGGVSLRAQTKAAGMNLTANSQHGLRVSGNVARNTQLALQNGRFVLRGRYGSGPTKVNLSKSGLTLSSRNELGTFNWIKPNRSSAKVFGIQMRGRKAANAQLAFMLLSLIAVVASLAFRVIWVLLNWAWRLLVMAWQLLMLTPYGWEQLQRKLTAWRVARRRNQLSVAQLATLGRWDATQLIAALALACCGWGRGLPLQQVHAALAHELSSPDADPLLQAAATRLATLAPTLEQQTATLAAKKQPLLQLTLTAELGRLLLEKHQQVPAAELLLQLDELMLRAGPKTRFQQQMLAVLSDALGLRLVQAEEGGAEAG